MSWRMFVQTLAICWTFALALVTYIIWAAAYLNGGTVTVAIDLFGEALFELVVLHALVIPVIAVGLSLALMPED